MKKRWRADACLILCGILVWFLTDAGRVRAAAAEALTLCGESVIPALFPFLAVSGLLVSMGFGEWISPLFAGLMGGYPIGARTAADLYRQGLLTAGEAERLLAFCNNSNPVFLVSVLGSGVFGSVRVGVWLWLIHIFSALVTGILFRGGGRSAGRQHPARDFPCRSVSFSSAFVKAVRSAAAGMLSVCAFVVLFYVLASPLAALGGRLGTALVGIVELFSLTPLLTPDRFGLILAAGCAGWGGLSVLCQTASVLDGSGLRFRNCFWGKLTQGLLSALLAAVLSGYILP